MLRSIQQALLLATIALVGALLVVTVLRSAQPPDDKEGQSPTSEAQQEYQAQKQDGGIIRSAFPDSISLFNFLLVIFTAGLVWSTILLYQSSEKSADISRQALVTVQRAFVFIDSFDSNMVNNDLVVMPKWRNSGSTPTRVMVNYVNWKAFTGGPPKDYSFPDLDGTGQPVSIDPKSLPITFIGPQATVFAYELKIPAAALESARMGQIRIFLWGWTRYKDVFGQSHITRFCNEMKLTGLGIDPTVPKKRGQKVSVSATFGLYGRHNCTDDECTIQGIP